MEVLSYKEVPRKCLLIIIRTYALCPKLIHEESESTGLLKGPAQKIILARDNYLDLSVNHFIDITAEERSKL